LSVANTFTINSDNSAAPVQHSLGLRLQVPVSDWVTVSIDSNGDIVYDIPFDFIISRNSQP
jgi:hypothetical protein